MDGARPTALRQSARNPTVTYPKLNFAAGALKYDETARNPLSRRHLSLCKLGQERRGSGKNRPVVIGVARSPACLIVRCERRLGAFLPLRSRPFQSTSPLFTALCAEHVKISQTLWHLSTSFKSSFHTCVDRNGC